MRILPFVAACILASPAARADALQEIFLRQKPGLWESKPHSPKARPIRFCATAETKAGGLEATLDGMKQLGCRRVKDTVSGDRFEIHLRCTSGQEGVGNFEMTMQGISRPDYMSQKGSITGGGALIKAIAAGPELAGSEWRWLRPCTPDEKPGLQASR